MAVSVTLENISGLCGAEYFTLKARMKLEGWAVLLFISFSVCSKCVQREENIVTCEKWIDLNQTSF